MTAEVVAVRFLPDRIRMEPRNVGIIATETFDKQSRTALRFKGVNHEGRVTSAPSGVPKGVYQQWVDYFAEKATSGRWADLKKLAKSRPTDFYLDHVRTLLEETSVDEIADEYFSLMVTQHSKRSREREELEDAVDKIFERANISTTRKPLLSAVSETRSAPFGFDLRATGNGREGYFDLLTSQSQAGDAQAFAWRSHQAYLLEPDSVRGAFVDVAAIAERRQDELLFPIESEAFVIDIGDAEEALETVREIYKIA